jgi:hypothetical protein
MMNVSITMFILNVAILVVLGYGLYILLAVGYDTLKEKLTRNKSDKE